MISSSSGILTTGNTTWVGQTVPSGGTSVATDQTGAGTVYDYANPFWSQAATNFFQVNGVGRTTGLLTSTTGPTPTRDAQWPAFFDQGDLTAGSDFAVNPVNGNEIVISSQNGGQGPQIFSTENQGQNWNVIGTQTDLDGTYAPALAYGAPTTGNPVDTFIYAGTTGGSIFVTFTGGGNGTSNNWINISKGLDGSPVEAIVTDPNHNTTDAYAVTQKGIYFMADSSATNASWTNITANLDTLMHTALNNPSYTQLAVSMLTSLVADWRYASPVLYVGGNSGVYRGIDTGGTWNWELFPAMSTDNAPTDGGYLPNVEVTDLDFATGAVNASTGIPQTAPNDPNILMASTFGDGAYAIRLAPIVTLNTASASPAGVVGVAGSIPINGVTTYYANADDNTITFNGSSEKTVTETVNGVTTTYNQVTINVYDLTNDPNETTPLQTITTTTNADGTFSVTIPRPSPDGLHDIVIVGTDQAGVSGPLVTVPLQVETIRPVITGFGLTPQTDTGVSDTDGITDNKQPTVTGTGAPGASVTISITNSSNVTTTFNPVMADDNGVFLFPIPSALADGTYTVSAVETDVALNTSLPVTFTLKIVTSISTPVALILSAASDSGVSSSDDLTNVTQPTFTGTASPNDTVTLYESLNGSTPSPTAPGPLIHRVITPLLFPISLRPTAPMPLQSSKPILLPTYPPPRLPRCYDRYDRTDRRCHAGTRQPVRHIYRYRRHHHRCPPGRHRHDQLGRWHSLGRHAGRNVIAHGIRHPGHARLPDDWGVLDLYHRHGCCRQFRQHVFFGHGHRYAAGSRGHGDRSQCQRGPGSHQYPGGFVHQWCSQSEHRRFHRDD